MDQLELEQELKPELEAEHVEVVEAVERKLGLGRADSTARVSTCSRVHGLSKIVLTSAEWFADERGLPRRLLLLIDARARA